jgi:tetratricopeptide (TPR) repeat protein
MFDELYVLRDRARSAAARGDLDTAVAALLAAAAQTHVAEDDYLAILRSLLDAFGKRGEPRSELAVLSYVASVDPKSWRHAAELLPHVPPVERAPVLAAQGRMGEAADAMENAGLLAGAAIYREKAIDWAAARALWSRLARATEHGEDMYVAALVRFNLSRCARQCGDAGHARESIVASVRLLEEAADHFESIGQRERAFDCFQVLVQIGRESGAFEDVLEGYVNSIRILREDHLKSDFSLKLFEESIAAATERGEIRAAATLAREAAEYARSLGLLAASTQYALSQAELWRALAHEQQARGAPVEVAENALLAAILAFGEIGQYARVGALYTELGKLDLDVSRREHYALAARRYDRVKDEPLEKSAGPSRTPQHEAYFTLVWHVDVLEWERQGSAAQACADVLFERRWGQLFRRKAMLARLTALHVEDKPDDASGWMLDLRLRLAEQLGQVQLYAVLSPLEKLFERPERRVKIAVLKALQMLHFKRSFLTVRAGLRDADPVVVDGAAKTVEALGFPLAIDPLSRILRESPQPAVRASALRALAGIDTLDAAELVLGALEHGSPADRMAALAAVKETRGRALIELARRTLPGTAGALRESLRELLAERAAP